LQLRSCQERPAWSGQPQPLLRTAIFDPQQHIYYADANDRSVRALPVRDNVWMIVGAGGNITVQTGDDGVLVVDTGNGGASTEKVQTILRAISTKPIRYILNTSFRPDHTGGNEPMRGAPLQEELPGAVHKEHPSQRTSTFSRE
jgi:glyoxylase-like metal-dependent hydrolase (beta-lactamase superfamily II)